MGDVRSPALSRWGRAAAWSAVFVVVWGAATGLALLLAWGPVALWTDGHGTVSALLFTTVVVPSFAALAAAGAVDASTRGEGSGRPVVVAAVGGLLMACGWIGTFITGIGVSEQAALHDRGVQVAAVVTGHWESSTLDGTKTGADVRLPDGSSLRMDGRQPAVGTAVTVTRDPRSHVSPRWGPRPGAPDRTLLAVFASGLPAGALLVAAMTAGPLSRDLSRPLRPRAAAPSPAPAPAPEPERESEPEDAIPT